jgi:hypothetical protein
VGGERVEGGDGDGVRGSGDDGEEVLGKKATVEGGGAVGEEVTGR